MVKRVTVDAKLLGCLRLSSREIAAFQSHPLLSWPLPLFQGGACSPP